VTRVKPRGYEISVFDSQETARDFHMAVLANDTATSPFRYATNTTVTPSVWEADTDNDGLDDEQEYLNATGATEADTDGDGLNDTTELARNRTDPTVYDIRAPLVEVLSGGSYEPTWDEPADDPVYDCYREYQCQNIREQNEDAKDVSPPDYVGTLNYTVRVDITDASGIQSVRLYEQGEDGVSRTIAPTGAPMDYEKTIEVSDHLLGTLGTYTSGTRLYVRADDTHDNNASILAYTEENIIASGNPSPRYAFSLGVSSGMVYGAGETGGGFLATAKAANSPIKTVNESYHRLDDLPAALKQMPTAFDRTQKLNNPYEDRTIALQPTRDVTDGPMGSPDIEEFNPNRSYENGFVTGYSLFLTGETAVTGGGSKVISSGSKFETAVDVATSKSDSLASMAKYGNGVHKSTRTAVSLTAKRLGRGSDSLKQTRTVGAMVRAKSKVSGPIETGTLTATYLRKGDLYGRSNAELDAAGSLYDEVDDDKASRLLRRLGDDQQAAFLSDDLDTSTRTDLYDAWQSSDDLSASDVGEAANTYNGLDSSDQRTYQGLLNRQGEGATKLAAESESDSLSTLLDAGCSGTSASVSTSAVGGGSALASGTDYAYSIGADSATLAVGTSDCTDSDTLLIEQALADSSADWGDVGAGFSRMDEDMISPVATRMSRNPEVADSLEDLSTSRVKTLADETEGSDMADALELHASDAPYERILSAAKSDDVDLSDLNTGLQRYDNNDIDINPSDAFSERKGDVGESVARQIVANEYSGDEYTIYQGVKLKNPNTGNTQGEFDYVVADSNGDVVEVYEVKAGNNKHTKAMSQLKDSQRRIDNGVAEPKPDGLHVDDFGSDPTEIDRTTIGPSSDSNYDVQMELSDKEFEQLTTIIDKR